jgi:hypothetical protein
MVGREGTWWPTTKILWGRVPEQLEWDPAIVKADR